jgi:hypothetical protein
MASNLQPFRAAYRNRTDDLGIKRVSRCVARRLKARASFMFAGEYRWLSWAAAGDSGHLGGTRPWCVGQVLGGAAPSNNRLLRPTDPGICREGPHGAGDGPVPRPGSLPGPWFLARVLPEAQCQQRPEVISGGNASALDIEEKHVTIQGPSPELSPAAAYAPSASPAGLGAEPYSHRCWPTGLYGERERRDQQRDVWPSCLRPGHPTVADGRAVRPWPGDGCGWWLVAL